MSRAPTKSPRQVVRDTLVKYAKQVRNSGYFVKRGAIVWSSFPFGEHPRAIAIMFDDIGILRQKGMTEAKIGIEMFASMPEGTEPEIDDGLLDELIEDAEFILQKTIRERDSVGDSVILRLDGETANVVESHDSTKRVQGIVVTFNVNF